MEPLATLDDLTGRLGRTLTDDDAVRGQILLADASAGVRGYTGQDFTLAEDDTVRLRVKNRRITLPQRPVVDVTSVQDTNGNDVTYEQSGDVLRVDGTVPDSWSFEPRRSGLIYVDVTYTHGYDSIPDDIIGVVCQVAGRAFGVPVDAGGVQSESLGAYSYTVGTAAASGAFGLLPDERAVLDRYRRELGVIALTP